MNALPYRLCALDLDETLLGANHALSETNAAAVRAIIEQGVLVMLASGRMHESALPFYEQLDLDTPIVSYNGAVVRHPRTGEEWLHEWVPGELAAPIMDYCRENDLQLNYYRDDVIYTARHTDWLELYRSRTQSPVRVHPDFYAALYGLPSTKLIIVDSIERTNALLPVFQERFGDALYITKTTDEYLEFMPPTANKGSALELAAERYGVTAAETVAFGDSFNDIPMIQWAGLGVAVGNAKPALKAEAQRIVGRADEDGVGLALREIFGV